MSDCIHLRAPYGYLSACGQHVFSHKVCTTVPADVTCKGCLNTDEFRKVLDSPRTCKHCEGSGWRRIHGSYSVITAYPCNCSKEELV